ncbi:MAG: transferrin-binding protein-like solute binding protein [Beijerinckiaceae bacterium]|nr:transferrin-binding protein-like solute binding protein [Beijerinckiaceae bacterium]
MVFLPFDRVGLTRPFVVCLLAGSLGGCYTLGGGAGKSAASPSTPTPAKFASFSGTVTSKGVITQAVTNQVAGTSTLTVETKDLPAQIETFVQPPDPTTKQQRVDFRAGGYGYFGTDEGKVEHSGAAVRGSAVHSADTWVIYTNTPGSRLDTSLGAPSLQHSYVGVASLGKRAAGSSGSMYSYSAGFFGGESTANMPVSGKAEYAGTFEGFQETSVNGSELVKSNISGKANLAVDFGANTVRGRIDDINNHSAGPVKVATEYSVGYNGSISKSSFTGMSWLTQKNSDMPLNGFSQNSGTLQGGFFGPGAAEAAGAVGVSAASESKKYLITGAFGAKKK